MRIVVTNLLWMSTSQHFAELVYRSAVKLVRDGVLWLREIKVKTGIESFDGVHVVKAIFAGATLCQVGICYHHDTFLLLLGFAEVVGETGWTVADIVGGLLLLTF